jgi:hypothetical protein
MNMDSENSGIPATMLVGPTGYGNNGGGFGNFGGDGWWIILLLLFAGGGWGMGGFGGFGGGLGYDFPWLLNGQNGINNNVNDGFRDAQLHDSVTSVRDGVSALATQLCGCCGDIQMGMANGFAGVQQSLCNGFAGTTAAITGAQNAISQQMNANEIANLNRSFAEQTANMQGFNGVNAGVADLRYTVATEACADRAAVGDALQNVTMQNMSNTNTIVNAINGGIQSIKDQLCDYRNAQKDDTIANLRQELMYSRGQASQVEQTAQLLANNNAQTALFQQGLNNEVDALYNRLKNCPVGTTPVYGNQPIFTCGNGGCGCGCGA